MLKGFRIVDLQTQHSQWLAEQRLKVNSRHRGSKHTSTRAVRGHSSVVAISFNLSAMLHDLKFF